jgi:indole-3-glycerol phosphate synthase
MSDFLQQMATLSAERAAAAPRCYSDNELDKPLHALRLNGFDLIAELKDNSPSEGTIAGNGNDRLRQAECYANGGAAAVSVLTEPTTFGGRLSHLADVAALLHAHAVPAMRKDFLVDKVQILEARANGASGVLLIAALLDDKALPLLLDCAYEHGMFVLLESFDEDDLRRSALLLETHSVLEHLM